MKATFYLLALSIILVSCSTNDSETASDTNNDNGTEMPNANFFPSDLNTQWIYDVESTSDTNSEFNFNVSETVRITTIDANMFTTEVNNGAVDNPALGTANAILTNGTLTKNATELLFNGVINLENLNLPVDFSFTVEDFALYNNNAPLNTEIAATSNTISETITLNNTTYPISINYNLKNTKLADLSNFTVNTISYNNVISTRITMAVTATVSFGFPLGDVNILNPQNVLSMTNYYAENVGLIQSEAQQGFEINPTLFNILNTLGVNAEFPENVSVLNVQKLNAFIPAN